MNYAIFIDGESGAVEYRWTAYGTSMVTDALSKVDPNHQKWFVDQITRRRLVMEYGRAVNKDGRDTAADFVRYARQQTMVQAIASAIGAYHRCKDDAAKGSEHHERMVKVWESKLIQLQRELPSGSGIDSGTTIDITRSTENRIVLVTAFHHMDTNGCYDGWTSHDIVVTPAFDGVEILVKGRNRNDIKSYLADTYHHALTSPAPSIDLSRSIV